VKHYLPPQPLRGRKRSDDRRTLNGILYVLQTDCSWRNLPRRYGSYETVHCNRVLPCRVRVRIWIERRSIQYPCLLTSRSSRQLLKADELNWSCPFPNEGSHRKYSGRSHSGYFDACPIYDIIPVRT
jgi:hypothetical protein